MARNVRAGPRARPHPPVGAPLAAPALTLTISLAEIYHSLCPSCRDALVDLLAHKAAGNIVADALRAQFDAAITTPPVGAGPRACPPESP